MRKIKLCGLLLLASIVGISSCKKDSGDSANDAVRSKLLGTWLHKKELYTVASSAGTIEEVDTAFGSQDYLQFKSDGSGIELTPSYSDNFAYTITDDGKTLNVLYEGESEPIAFTIQTVTSSQLILVNETTFSSGATIRYEETYSK